MSEEARREVGRQAEIARAVAAIVRELAAELRPAVASRLSVQPDSRLDRDLGIDSLGRAELALRLEQRLGVALAGEVLEQVATVRDLVAAVLAARGTPLSPLALLPQPALGEQALPTGCATLVDVLQWHASRQPERVHVYLVRENAPYTALTFAALAAQAHRIAAGIRALGVEPGERVVLMMPTSPEFLAAFMGVLRAGAVVVPIYPPVRREQLAEHLLRQKRIVDNAEPKLLLVTPALAGAATLLHGIVPGLRTAVVDPHFGADAAVPEVSARADDIALIQYTSGSTGDPKGVVLAHSNLVANIRAMGNALGASSADICVSWLPLYHDMGLIGAWLGSLWHAATLVLLTPQHFLARPGDWLRAIHEARATVTAAPNFAYELCLRRVPDSLVDALDLSSVRVFANGAEPVRASTLRRFLERFGRCGLRPEALKPVYGLAENSVGLAFPPLDRPPRIEAVAVRPLRERGEVRPPLPGEPAIECVGCGVPLPGHEIRIVDAAGRELPERRQGRIQFRGPSATRGYFRNEAATRALFADGWLETGDLGWLAEGELFVGGRLKDLIIRSGRNIHPQDVEAAVEEVAGVRRGGVAAIAVAGEGEAGERLVVLVETRERDPMRRSALVEAVASRVVEALGEPADEIVLLPPRTLPKTSSGKLRRSLARELFEAGELGRGRAGFGRQLLGLLALALVERGRRLARGVAAFGFALRFWTAIGLMAVPAWLCAMLLPDGPRLRRILRALARIALRSAGVPPRLSGTERLPPPPFVVVANHASYLDGVVCVAALDVALAFVAKAELGRHPLAGPFLRRIGTLFVTRWQRGEETIDPDAVRRVIGSGRLPLVFPEGTFTRQPGLLRFHLGAFRLACDLGLAVVPVAIRGTRSVLRAGQWFPFRHTIEVEILDLVWPEGRDFAAARRLRDRVRQAILEAVREPDREDEVVIWD
ncbi:4-hydroxyphenylalkanoate adenylyltransferase [bacterium HR40]|nr:4-hydroxyphenylalkanoate adenylyltransferase [bacterium HR40]